MSFVAVTPTQAVNAIITELSRFLPGGAEGTGAVRTIARVAGDRYDLEMIDGRLTKGVPAWLILNLGGPFEGVSTTQMLFEHQLKLSIVCAAGGYASIEDRLSGSAADPGIEDLLDWATYYGCRALHGVDGLSRVQPTAHKWLRIQPQKYLAAVEISAVRELDLYDDAAADHLRRVGLVHDPLDPDVLFVDGEPNTTWRPTLDGGVATIIEE